MAIARTSPIITSISGAVGGIQFVASKAGTRIRLRPSRRPTPTARVIAQQAVFNRCKHLWRDLTPNERLNWGNLALALTASNQLAQKYTPTPYNTFMRHRIPYYTAWPLLDPGTPLARVTDQPLSVSLDFTEGADYYITYTTYAADGNQPYLLYGANVYSRTLPSTYPPFRFVSLLLDYPMPADISYYWDQEIGPLRAGQWAVARVVPFYYIHFPASPSYFATQVAAP